MPEPEVAEHVYVSLWETCDQCNYRGHTCHFCGEDLDHESFAPGGKRHWLSDCRPDLVAHEAGPDCTWTLMAYSTEEHPHSWSDERVDQFNVEHGRPGCYAFQDRETGKKTAEHIHFYPDGPMT